ncbi:right-handed parallel beta-helix repeat-containing protein [Paenibacillus dakarensis]|uniref:right-handed parallel beta-helix repeat-containing protein n=1 Tax=Paenibacillus dakarensis TaxID=1527293 RepID=UPI0006D5A381|nr:right-handed parallel beta-helix repeat-containing protein [Paenibacillus dakarensis]
MSRYQCGSNLKLRSLTLLLLPFIFLFNYHVSAIYADENKQKIYYVSTSGDDSNPGTLSSPWRTIQKAADTLKPGETVFVRGGVYSEFVSIKSSGSKESGMIQFENYMGEVPVIDGTNLQLESSNPALVLLSNAHFVKIKGFEIRNLGTSDHSVFPAGIRIYNGGSNIQLVGNNVHHIRNTSNRGNAHGIHVLGNTATPITNLIIDNNQVHHLTLGKSESLTLSGNIDGFEITNNKVYENNNIGIELAGFYGACSEPCVDQTRNGLVSGNTVYHIDSSNNQAYGTGVHAAAGIYADGAANIIIERNHSYQNDFGIELASEKQGKYTSHITVRNNYIHHNYGSGITLGGASSSNGGAVGNVIINNTFIENDSLKRGDGDITLQWNNQNNQFLNNIIYSNSQKLLVNKINSSGSGNKMDFNVMYSLNGTKGSVWKWNGVKYTAWGTYKNETGNDMNSLYGDPHWVDKGSGNIRLKPGSIAIDKGKAYSGLEGAYDYYGAPRKIGKTVDAGASEYVFTPMNNSKKPYVIDGNEKDWSKIPVLSKGTGNIKSLKATQDEHFLSVLVQGQNLEGKNQLFLNTDNSLKTGYTNSYWSSSGADYMLENGILYVYSGEGENDWNWSEIRNYVKAPNYVLTKTTMEMSIPLTDLNVNQHVLIKIGYIRSDLIKDKLPVSGGLINVVNTNNLADKMKIFQAILLESWKN